MAGGRGGRLLSGLCPPPQPTCGCLWSQPGAAPLPTAPHTPISSSLLCPAPWGVQATSPITLLIQKLEFWQ